MVPHTPTADANGKYPIDIEATSPTVKSMVLEMEEWYSIRKDFGGKVSGL
jgi:hypothetical protein